MWGKGTDNDDVELSLDTVGEVVRHFVALLNQNQGELSDEDYLKTFWKINMPLEEFCTRVKASASPLVDEMPHDASTNQIATPEKSKLNLKKGPHTRDILFHLCYHQHP